MYTGFLFSVLSSGDGICSLPGHVCLESMCCTQQDSTHRSRAAGSFGCFKKRNQNLARCREITSGHQDASWLAPGLWEHCGDAYQSCYESKCCKHHEFGCFKQRNKPDAQCRALRSSLDHKSQCIDTDEWLCPGGEWEHCALPQAECTDSKCCKDIEFGCFKHPLERYAEVWLPHVGKNDCTT